MQDKKNSSFVNISNFSKTKGLNGNKALNKNSSNGKNKRQRQFNLEPKKMIF